MKKSPRSSVVRWAPVNAMDLQGMELWLERMAAQGLIYQEQSRWNLLLGGPYNPHLLLVRFRREEPAPGRRYRVVPAPKNSTEPSQELRELYQSTGWRYVDFFNFVYLTFFLFETDDPGAVEPFTDPQSLALAFRPAWGIVALVVLALLVNFLLDVDDLTDSWASVQSGWDLAGLALFLLILIVVLGGLLVSVLDLAAVFLLRKQVRRGTTRPTLPRWLFSVQRALTCFFLGIELLAVAAVLILSLFLPRTIPLEDWEPDFDLLTLAEMEGDGSWIPSQDLIGPVGMRVRYNNVEITSHPFGQLEPHYQANQNGSGTSGDSSLDLDYYVADTAQATAGLLADLEQSVLHPEDPLTAKLPDTLPFQEESVPGAEIFRVRREGEYWEVLAQTGTRALFLEYSGSLDLTLWYEDIAAMLIPSAPAAS